MGVTFERLDSNGILVGHVHHPLGDVANELVAAGLAKTSMPKKDEEYDRDGNQLLESDSSFWAHRLILCAPSLIAKALLYLQIYCCQIFAWNLYFALV